MYKNVIIYYSWQCATDLVAKEIHAITEYPMERIIEVKADKRKMGNAAFGAFFRLKSKIMPLKTPIDQTQTILLGTPIWAFNIPPAINRWLSMTNLKNKDIYLFGSKGLDNTPTGAIELIKKKIEKKGGHFKDAFFVTSEWSPENPVLPNPSTYHDTLKDWLSNHQLTD